KAAGRRPICLVALSGLLIVACTFARAQEAKPVAPKLTDGERQALLKEWLTILKERQTLDQQGQVVKAIDAAERMVVIDRRLLGSLNEVVAMDLEWIAERREEGEEFDA